MIRLSLTPEQRATLRTLRRAPLAPAERDRVEMLLLHAEGWSAPKLGAHFGYTDQWVRMVLKDFAARGLASVYSRPMGPAPDRVRRARVEAALRRLLVRDRSWNATQLAAALRADNIVLSARQVRRYLARMRARYRRSRPSVRHRQNSADVRHGRRQLGAYRALARRGQLRLYFFDECGFAPSQPTGKSWYLPGQSRHVRYENPQRRRVTALGTYAPYGRRKRLRATVVGKSVTHDDVLRVLRRIAHAPRRQAVVVLDNAPVHLKAIRVGGAALARAGLKLIRLPAYAPELNRIEEQFGIIKYHYLPERTYDTQERLHNAVVRAFDQRARDLAA